MFKPGDEVIFTGYKNEDGSTSPEPEVGSVIKIETVNPKSSFPYRSSTGLLLKESELVSKEIYKSPVYQLLKD